MPMSTVLVLGITIKEVVHLLEVLVIIQIKKIDNLKMLLLLNNKFNNKYHPSSYHCHLYNNNNNNNRLLEVVVKKELLLDKFNLKFHKIMMLIINLLYSNNQKNY